MNICHNAFTGNLGSDWVAIDRQGNPVCRAGDEDTVRRAVPHAALYMTSGKTVYADGSVVLDPVPKPEPAALEPKVALNDDGSADVELSPAPDPEPDPEPKVARAKARGRK